jgi:tetrathionate reductase subunit B
MKVMVIDESKCNGCHNCQIACKDEHVGNDWSPYAGRQPLKGHFWIKVNAIERGSFPKVKVSHKHDICQHCADAPCIPACKRQAIVRRPDGIVLIEPDKCRGDKSCLDACPYGVIYFNDDVKIAQKCTFCAHLLDKGEKEPRCVNVCPTGALTFGDKEDLKDVVDRAEVVEPPGINTKPNVYYIALPRKFIAGAVYDPDEDECIEGATVTLTNNGNGKTLKVRTDEFGDFWFEGLEVETFSLSIEQDGYKMYQAEPVSTEKDVNLGEIAMRKTKYEE